MRITTSAGALLAGAGITSAQFTSPRNGVYSFAVSSGPSELLGWNVVAAPRAVIDQDSDAGFVDLVPPDSAPATEFSFYCPGSAFYIYCQMTGSTSSHAPRTRPVNPGPFPRGRCKKAR